jgi:NTE family protein
MLAELTDRGIRPDRVYGASVGAVNAAAYCGDPTSDGIARMESIWRGVTGELVFPTGRVHGPWKFFQQRPAVHPNWGLRRIVEEGLLFERLEESPLPLEVVATSLVDGRERWFSEGPAAEAILASAAIPSILPPVALDGDVLVDGGVVDNVPISRPIAQGLTRLYVLLCGPMYFRPPMPRRPVENLVTAFFIGIHARFAREVAALPPGVEVVVFSGGDPPADYRDFSETAQMIEAGRAEVAAVLDGDREGVHHGAGPG